MTTNSERSVVSVYGLRDGDEHPVRLGNGFLAVENVVGLKGELKQEMSSEHPPQILRVGIASLDQDGQMFVEVIEVRQVLQSADHHPGLWAAELWTLAQSPTNLEADAAAEGYELIPQSGICYLFPWASFC